MFRVNSFVVTVLVVTMTTLGVMGSAAEGGLLRGMMSRIANRHCNGGILGGGGLGSGCGILGGGGLGSRLCNAGPAPVCSYPTSIAPTVSCAPSYSYPAPPIVHSIAPMAPAAVSFAAPAICCVPAPAPPICCVPVSPPVISMPAPAPICCAPVISAPICCEPVISSPVISAPVVVSAPPVVISAPAPICIPSCTMPSIPMRCIAKRPACPITPCVAAPVCALPAPVCLPTPPACNLPARPVCNTKPNCAPSCGPRRFLQRRIRSCGRAAAGCGFNARMRARAACRPGRFAFPRLRGGC